MQVKDLKKNRGFALIVFFLLFLCALVVSIGIRTIALIQNSSFSDSSFTTLVVADSTHIVRVDTSQEIVSILEIASNDIRGENLVLDGMKIGVPLNGAIVFKDTNVENVLGDVFSVPKALSCVVRTCATLRNMNSIDRVKLAFAIKNIPSENVSHRTINNYTHDFSIQRQITDELYELFRDPEIVNEQVSISVINGSDIAGVATQVSAMLEHGGYTVVAVESDEKQLSRIELYDPNSKTARIITQLFPFPVKQQSRASIADITIVVGQDFFE